MKEGEVEKSAVQFSGRVEKLCIYFRYTQVYIVIKIHQTEPLKSVYFSVY